MPLVLTHRPALDPLIRHLVMYKARNMKLSSGFFPGIFQEGAKSIVMQISFVMLIFLLFSDPNFRGQKSLRGANCLRGALPLPILWRKASLQIASEGSYSCFEKRVI